jgi:hypothetical protein
LVPERVSDSPFVEPAQETDTTHGTVDSVPVPRIAFGVPNAASRNQIGWA